MSLVNQFCLMSSGFQALARDPDDQPAVPKKFVCLVRIFDTELGEVVGFTSGLMLFDPTTGLWDSENLQDFPSYPEALDHVSGYLQDFVEGCVL